MKLSSLRYYIAVAKYGNFIKESDWLFISQPPPEPDDSGAKGRTWNTAVYPGAPFPEIDRGWRLAFKWKTLF